MAKSLRCAVEPVDFLPVSPRDVPRHVSVLQTAAFDLLKPQNGETVIDCTLGLGGHASAFAERVGPSGQVIGIDADGDNLAIAKENLSVSSSSIRLIHGNFRDLASFGLPPADIIFADLGLSSPHLDDPTRGFSFRADGPLDLRFDRTKGKPVAELLNGIDDAEILRVLRTYGELSAAHHLAKQIRLAPPKTTAELKVCIEKAYGWRAKALMPQIFQALRIWVNDEIGSLEALLRDAPYLLKPGGRFAVISFHSLEDRLVKMVFRTMTTAERDPITGAVTKEAPYRLLTRKPIRPDADEVALNPRSRSALLRAILRT